MYSFVSSLDGNELSPLLKEVQSLLSKSKAFDAEAFAKTFVALRDDVKNAPFKSVDTLLEETIQNLMGCDHVCKHCDQKCKKQGKHTEHRTDAYPRFDFIY